MTPFGETALWVSLKARGSLLSAKRRLPLPSSSGNVNVRISSTRPAASNECTSSVLPCVTSAGPSSCFSFATSLAPSRNSTEPFQVRSAPLRVATYFLMRLNAVAMSSYDPPSAKGQYAAKMSYVRRPSRRSNGWPNNLPISSPNTGSTSAYGATQPPNLKPPVGSSSGPPGACITPSSETIAPTTTFLMVLSCSVPRTNGSRRSRHRLHQLLSQRRPRLNGSRRTSDI